MEKQNNQNGGVIVYINNLIGTDFDSLLKTTTPQQQEDIREKVSKALLEVIKETGISYGTTPVKEEEKVEPKYNVGEYVVRTSVCDRFKSDYKVGRIIGFDEDYYQWPQIEGEITSKGDQDAFNPKFLRKATPQEIEAHLIAKAKELGFKEGVKVNRSNLESGLRGTSLISSCLFDKGENRWDYTDYNDILSFCGTFVYEKGVWATIVEEKKPEYESGDKVVITAISGFVNTRLPQLGEIEHIQNDYRGVLYGIKIQEFINGRNQWLFKENEFHLASPEEIKELSQPTAPNITINGYKAEFHDEYVKFGCAKIDAELFTEFMQAASQIGFLNTEEYENGNKGITGIQIGTGLFTIDQIEEIAEYYNNK